MEITDYLIIFSAGCIAGFINTVAGGGSLLTLPIMIFMGLPSVMANGTNRVGIFMQNIFAVWGFKSKGVTVFPYALWLGISSLIGAVIGAKIAMDISGDLFNKILAVVMLVVLAITLFNPLKGKGEHGELLDFKHRVIAIISFFFIGIYGGFIHAGIGFIIIATLTTVNRFNLVKTNAIKVLVALIYTAFALGVFALEGQVDWLLGVVLGCGTAIGGWTASRWSVSKGDKWIRYFLVVTVCVMSIKLWFFS